MFNKSNGVPIIPFYDNYEDKELLKLTNYLKTLANSSDFRTSINNTFKHDKITENIQTFDKIKKEV